jgi:2-polyprenyl-3-methyl-5-hydroxy-6-metoxy-1,4-benzoquinol methylase
MKSFDIGVKQAWLKEHGKHSLNEEEKYVKCWGVDDYRDDSPAERNIAQILRFLEAVKCQESVIDWGCGTGRASKKLYDAGYVVTMIDIAGNCLDSAVRDSLCDRFQFINHDLTKSIDIESEAGLCVDVMEHLPEDLVDVAIENIISSSKYTFFSIYTDHEAFSYHEDILEELHLCVRKHSWWASRLVNNGAKIEFFKNHGKYALFIVSVDSK